MDRARFAAAAETAVLTLAVPLLGLWLRPADPLFANAGFFWPLLGPVCAGLRYGFACGLGAAAALDLLLFRSFPGAVQPALATALLACAAGEFRDVASRSLARLKASAAYQRERLDRFARSYELLRLSHDRLGMRLAGKPSLRDALAAARAALARLEGKGTPEQAAGALLAVMAEHGGLTSASLHWVDAQGRVRPAAASVGGPAALHGDPLIAEAIATRSVVHLPQALGGAVLAAVPLVDVTGALRGVVAVTDLPWLSFNEENLRFLGLLGAQLADELAALGPESFELHLQRARQDAQRFSVPFTLVEARARGPRARQLLDQLVQHRRSLDPADLSSDGGRLRILLRSATLQDAEGFRARALQLLKPRVAEEVTLELFPLHKTEVSDAQVDPVPARV